MLLNLCKEKIHIVERLKKKNKPCNKKAKFFKNDKYYCKICAKNKKYKIPLPEYKNKKKKT